MQARKSRYFGDRKFYGKVLTIAVPIMIQNGITQFVNMLDNVMVGQLGTDPIAGVAIVNQFFFVFNLCIFGAMSGVGIFAAQFYGKGDHDGVRYSFRLQVWLGLALTALGVLVFLLLGRTLVMQFLTADAGGGTVEGTLFYAEEYLSVLIFGLLPFMFVQCYANTLRQTSETVVPMVAGLCAVGVNLVGNYILIYGKFGAPALGVKGAAMATVFSRVIEMLVVAIWTHTHTARNRFIVGVYRRPLDIPHALVGQMLLKALPLLLNETLWAGGQTMLMQCYSVRGLSAVTALNIANTISNVFNIAFVAMGEATAILLGQMLGRGELEKAKADATRLAVFSVLLCVGAGVLMAAVSGVFPLVYNTTSDIRHLATGLILVYAVFMPVYAYENAAYFTIRSGGKTFITFIFDSGFVWVVSIPLALILSRGTSLPLMTMFVLVNAAEFLKCLVGYVMKRSGKWAVNLTV